METMNVDQFRPLSDRVLVRPQEQEEKTSGGILVPKTAEKEKPMMGTIVAVGMGKPLDNGDVRSLDVKKGDKVIFGKYAGTEIKAKGDDTYLIMREEDIMGVVEK